MNHIEYLKSLVACKEAIAFASNYPDLPSAYAACVCPDWLFWLAGRTGVTRQQIVLAACACARTALPYAKGPEALTSIETTEAWCRGEVTIDRVCAAADAAYAYSYRAADRAARRAAAAADAADAIAAYAAAVGAADAADAIADAADCAAMCDLIRAIIPCPPTG
jgi:hypothetical protein